MLEKHWSNVTVPPVFPPLCFLPSAASFVLTILCQYFQIEKISRREWILADRFLDILLSCQEQRYSSYTYCLLNNTA